MNACREKLLSLNVSALASFPNGVGCRPATLSIVGNSQSLGGLAANRWLMQNLFTVLKYSILTVEEHVARAGLVSLFQDR